MQEEPSGSQSSRLPCAPGGVLCVFPHVTFAKTAMGLLGSDPSPAPIPRFACDEGAHRRPVSPGVVRREFSSPWLSGVLAIV